MSMQPSRAKNSFLMGFIPLEKNTEAYSAAFHDTDMSMQNHTHAKNSFLTGFTIPEMLVAFTIFSVVMSVTSVIFINISRSYRIAAGFLNAQNTLRYSMELISREVKEGTNYSAPNPTEFDFTDKAGAPIAYLLQNGFLMRREGTVGAPSYSITDNRLNVTRFTPVVAQGSATVQPHVTFLIAIVPKGDISHAGDLSFTLQTTVTQRRIIAQ